MPTHPRRLVAVVLALLLVATIAPSNPAAAGPLARSKERIQGTWPLQQGLTRGQLTRLRPKLESALRVPGVTGLSLRVPWSLLEPRKGRYDFRVLQKALKIARPKELSVRFIAGAYTPAFR